MKRICLVLLRPLVLFCPRLPSMLGPAAMTVGLLATALAWESPSKLGIVSSAAAADHRFEQLKDLDGFFPFSPPETREAWEARREQVRRRVLVAEGLWPPPTKNPLQAVIHGTIDVDDPLTPGGGYTVSKVFFESLPGFFVTGNLYRPRMIEGTAPGVLFSHGHHKDARLTIFPESTVRREISEGQERFERGGVSLYQSMCVQLARMGCVVWQWDMLGDSDSQQLSRDLVHGFATERPEMNDPQAFGLFSPQAESRLITAMGLQTWNAVRSLDFLLSLPEVDPSRVAMTGSSGGGTQTMLLAAVDDRLALSFPVVMVSTSMQGGCTCENASLLRIGTGNVELAALFAPKPQGMNTADDWTKELATKGFPDLQKVYGLFDVGDRLMLLRGEHFPHNYNAVTRSAFQTFLSRHFGLGFPEPVLEHDYQPLSPEQLSVWNEEHPAPPAADPDFEQRLVTDLAADIEQQVHEAAATEAGIDEVLRPALETILDRSFAAAGSVRWEMASKDHTPGLVRMAGVLRNETHDEEVPVTWLYPDDAQGNAWKGSVVIWLDGQGQSAADEPDAAIATLVAAGTAVVTADLYHRRDQSLDDVGRLQQRKVKNPRDYAGYTFGYNDPAFVRSVHDVLTILAFLKNTQVEGHPSPSQIALAGFDDAAAVALAARISAGEAIDRAAVDTDGFRFAALNDWRHPLFLPGAVRYLDVPGLVAAGRGPLWLAGETADALLPPSRKQHITLIEHDPSRADAAAWLAP
jgi:hypothetical protein